MKQKSNVVAIVLQVTKLLNELKKIHRAELKSQKPKKELPKKKRKYKKKEAV